MAMLIGGLYRLAPVSASSVVCQFAASNQLAINVWHTN